LRNGRRKLEVKVRSGKREREIGMELGSGLGDGISSVQDCEVVPSSDLV